MPRANLQTSTSCRQIYVRPENESVWKSAVKLAKKRGMSLSDLVAEGLRTLLDAESRA